MYSQFVPVWITRFFDALDIHLLCNNKRCTSSTHQLQFLTNVHTVCAYNTSRTTNLGMGSPLVYRMNWWFSCLRGSKDNILSYGCTLHIHAALLFAHKIYKLTSQPSKYPFYLRKRNNSENLPEMQEKSKVAVTLYRKTTLMWCSKQFRN